MNRDEAVAVVKQALAGIAPEVDVDTLDVAADLQADLDLDSMDFLNLVIAVHDRTGVDIPERDYPRLSSVSGFAEYLVAA